MNQRRRKPTRAGRPGEACTSDSLLREEDFATKDGASRARRKPAVPGGPAVPPTIHPPGIHLASLGCSKNLIDSEELLARLGEAGAIVGAAPEQADVIIVNTCGFIQSAKEESIDAILELARYKQTGRCRALLVMGCLGQRYAAELKAELPEVDAVFGLGAHSRIAAACGLGRASVRVGASESGTSPGGGRLLLTPPHTAYLRISEGCDNRCTYCAIPLIRGPFRSRPADAVLAEARRLVDSGVRELNLIAQDTTLYGTDLSQGPLIHGLIERLAEIPRLRWLRLLYTHPAHFSEELLAAYASIEKLCPYVDLPVQHLNDTILRRMGRKVSQARPGLSAAGAPPSRAKRFGTRPDARRVVRPRGSRRAGKAARGGQAEILRLIDRLRERVPGVVIRTSCIVGFPGETRRQFNELRELVRRIGFDHLGAFTYSREEGTPAAGMAGQVSERAKSRRLRDLMLAQQEIVRRKNAALRGEVREAVIDKPSSTGQDVWSARTRGQAPDVDGVTLVRGSDLQPGRFLDVIITGHRDYDLLARPA